MTAVLCGNRFGRSLVREGGVTYDLDDKNIDLLKKQVETLRKDFTNSADLLWNVPSVLARFENTGVVSREQCKILGLVGVAARACGMIADSRQDFPSGIYQFSHIPIITHSQGDVFARAFVRYGEVLHSLDFIAEQLGNLPPGPIHAACGPRAKNNLVISVCEGWRGEICHVGITDGNGSLLRYKIVDPSFHNWSGLALALQNQQISDFPLCNKSFNLSYSGFDL
jgi:Ni,Fe-hydrogenase III large subunit